MREKNMFAPCFFVDLPFLKMVIYPLVNLYITMNIITMFNGKKNEKLPCSIAFCMFTRGLPRGQGKSHAAKGTDDRPPLQLHRLVAPSDDTPSIGSPRRPPRPVGVVGLQNYRAKYIQP